MLFNNETGKPVPTESDTGTPFRENIVYAQIWVDGKIMDKVLKGDEERTLRSLPESYRQKATVKFVDTDGNELLFS